MPYDFEVNFSGLANLPRIYREAQQSAQRDAALEQLRANPNMPYDQGARLLIGGGDVAGGATLASIYNQVQQRALQARQLAEMERAHRAGEGHQAATLAETRRQHDIQALSPVSLGANLSGDIKGVRDPSAPGGFRIIDPNRLTTVGGGDTPQAKKDLPTGPAFLETLQPHERSLIQKVGDYEISPKTFSNRGQRERILGAVSQYNPDYDERKYDNANLTLKRFGSGQQGDTVRSMNVGIDHLDTLHEYVKALNQGNVQLINSLKNKIQQQFGHEAPTNFNAVKAIVGSEISKAIVGSRGALEDRKEIKEALTTASSAPQLMGAIQAYKKLMAGQVRGLKIQYEDAGLKGFDKKLLPATVKELGLLDVNATGDVANPATPNQIVNYRDYFK